MVDLAACDSHSSRSTVVLLMQQNMPEKQKGGTLVQRQEATCYG